MNGSMNEGGRLIMEFSEMNHRQLKEARDELHLRIYPVLHTSRVTKLTNLGVTLEGGALTAAYNAMSRELTVWGSMTKYRTGTITVGQLVIAESKVARFFDEYLGVK